MPDEKNPYLERKEKAVLVDLETAFSGYERLVRQVNLIRAWTVALMVAALGWLIAAKPPSPYLVVYPSTAALFAFLVLELRERSSMRFNKTEVLNLQAILMIEDQGEYEKAIRAYRFRDLRLEHLTRAERLGHLVDSTFTPQVVFWYLFWALVLAYVFLRL